MHSPKRPLFILLLCIVLAVGLAFLARPIYRKTKAWRGYYFLRQAESLASNNKLDEALFKASLAHQLNPQSLPIARFLAYHLSAYKRIEALAYWQAIVLFPDKNKDYPEDRNHFIDYCLNINYLEAATPYIQELLALESLKLEDYLVLIRYWQKAKHLDLALRMNEKAYQTYPEEATLALSLAQLLLYKKEEPSTQKAFELLLQIIERPESKARMNAYTLLAQNFDLSASLKDTILKDSLWQDSKYRYTLASLKLRLFPTDKQRIIQETLQETIKTLQAPLPLQAPPPQGHLPLQGYLANQDYLVNRPEDTLRLLHWLNAEGAFKESLELIPQAIALKSQHYILPYLDALAALNRWETLRDILLQENLPLDSFLLSVFRTRLGLELKDALLSQSQWNHTLALAKESPDQLLFLASYFEKLGKLDFAWQAYKPLLKQPNFAHLTAQHMLAISRSLGKTRDALYVFKMLNRHFPEDLEPQASLLYTELLLDENIISNRNKAQVLLETNPTKPYLAHLLALAYLKNGQAQAALATYDTYRPPLDYTSPGWKSVYIAVCFANHRYKEAEGLLKTLPLDDLLPEEEALLKPYLPLPNASLKK